MAVATHQVDALLALALDEDLGTGDVTSIATIPADMRAEATIVAKAPGIVAGMPIIEAVFARVDPEVVVTPLAADGDRIADPPMQLAHLAGPARAILAGERTALNILGHLCGIATATREYVDRVAGTGAGILDTRKTLPGLRVLDKYAVACGGGVNHRIGLFDAILIKDNHLRVAGGVRAAIDAARARYPELTLTVEVERAEQVREAVECGAQRIMLDNMTPDQMRSAVALIAGRAEVEASGGITLDTVRSVAETGVDVISVGAITHSAKWLDVSLEVS